jgi:SAM-dependent methyltransferase
MRQKHSTYQKEFEHFLSRTDEKEIFAKLITRFIKKNHIRSLLDIGAGDGRLALKIAKKVKTYVAVEQNPIFVKSLRAAGLNVIAKPFPCDIDRQFDMVLLSHVLSTNDYWKKIIPSVLRSLASPGHLMIIAI